VDIAGPSRWRWLLSDADTGGPLADHQVNLEAVNNASEKHRDRPGGATPPFGVPKLEL
jgi:hypothetical protein